MNYYTKEILVERHKDRKEISGTNAQNGSNKDRKCFSSNIFIGSLHSLIPIKYSFSIAPVLDEYCFSIESVLRQYYRSSLGVFQVHSRYIKNRFIVYFGNLKGLIYKFAIFLGRRPP